MLFECTVFGEFVAVMKKFVGRDIAWYNILSVDIENMEPSSSSGIRQPIENEIYYDEYLDSEYDSD